MIFTSEQVSWGHPDKICDQISDALVTELLRIDKNSRIALETMIKDYDIYVIGEVTTNADFCESFVMRQINKVLSKIGFKDSIISNYKLHLNVSSQSPDIAMGVNSGGAGDQGMMFGYATNETPEMLPIPFAVATYALELLRKSNNPKLCADAKSQVSYDYDTNRITTFLISTQHKEEFEVKDFYDDVVSVMKESAKHYGLNTDFKVLVNPTGRFVIGSSFGDSGLTGRKIIADTYGGMCHHGGGAFSGKDPSKVDRSGAYMARKVAKDIVKNGMCDRCEIQVAYAIGVSQPVSLNVETFGTEKIDKSKIQKFAESYDWTPNGIIDFLHLKDIDYNMVSSYGHFGNKDVPWEK